MATAAYAGGREMTLGGVFARAFGAIGAAPLLFFGAAFVLIGLPSILVGPASRAAALSAAAAGASPRDWLPMFVAALVVWWLLYMAVQALLLRATVALADGRREGLGTLAGAAARALLPLVGLSIVLSAVVWIGLLLFIVPGIMLAMLWSVAAPALVVERTGVFAALGRSQRLTRGARWRVFGLVALVFAVYLTAGSTLGVGAVAVKGMAAVGRPAAPPLISTIFSVVLQTAFVAVWSAIQAALYVELRDEKDGPAGDRLADIFA